jgi:hypothetical protein
MTLFFILGVGAVMIGVTIIIQVIVCDLVLRLVTGRVRDYCLRFGSHWKIPVLVLAVYCICASLMFHIWLWAFLIYSFDDETLGSISNALYYATSSFTTVGFADIEPAPEWRMLGAVAAMNGMILFGWSAAFIFEILAKLYDDDNIIRKRIAPHHESKK